MNKILVCIFISILSTVIFGQNSTDEKPKETFDRQVLELPKTRKIKPKLSLQKALKLTEKFIKEQKIDASRYYLSGVKMISRPDKEKESNTFWLFNWNNDEMILGDYSHILVSMDGKVWQEPTM